jgi:hypothetical protein
LKRRNLKQVSKKICDRKVLFRFLTLFVANSISGDAPVKVLQTGRWRGVCEVLRVISRVKKTAKTPEQIFLSGAVSFG